MKKATVVRNVTVSSSTWFDPYEGLNQSFRAVIRAANEELEAHPKALIRNEQGDPKPTLKVSGPRNSKVVTLTFQTQENV